jgi:hypothetical protein
LKSVNSSAGTHNSQGEIEQSASTFRSQSKVSPHDARNSGPVDRAAPPRTTKGGCYARAKQAKTGVVGDRGVSSVGDVDQLQGSRQLDHILVSRELLFTVTRLLNDGKDLRIFSEYGDCWS